MSTTQPVEKPDLAGAVARRALQLLLFILIQAAALFGGAGRLDWPMAWAYLAVYVGMIAVNAAVLLPRNAELIAERGRVAENTKGWDRILAVFYSLCSLVILVVAGLDRRFGWTPVFSVGILLAAFLFLLLGWAMVIWAMASNKFFSSVVRIQHDRGHAVATGGPYRFVRHPGYAAMMVSALATAVMLNSLWALIPTGLLIGLVVVRTRLEDTTLQDELEGYKAYAGRVRYRLLPGLW